MSEQTSKDQYAGDIKRLARLGAERLASELFELARLDPFAARRCELLAVENDPEELALLLRSHLADLKMDAESVRYQSDDHGFAARLEEILSSIQSRLCLLSPCLSLELLEDLFTLDAPLMESCDEGWELGLVFEDACKLWLRIAKDTDTGWLARVQKLTEQDDYGMRAGLAASR